MIRTVRQAYLDPEQSLLILRSRKLVGLTVGFENKLRFVYPASSYLLNSDRYDKINIKWKPPGLFDFEIG